MVKSGRGYKRNGNYATSRSCLFGICEGWEEIGLRANQCLPFTSFEGVSRNGNSYLFHGVWIKDWDGEMDENKEPGVRR